MANRGTNPFSTRYIRAGNIPFRFPEGDSADACLQRLSRFGWQAQIVGPHGSGKSTLLHALETHWPRFDRAPLRIDLHNGQRQLPKLPPMTAKTQLIIDGFEQLNWLARQRVYFRCRRQQAGLLVTTHRPLRLPVLLQTTSTLALAEQLTWQLLNAKHDELLERSRPDRSDAAHAQWQQRIEQCYREAGGNVREMFLKLYDHVP